ncbi:hypothetical protein Droror1_Dr00014601 [Drosera rotundifolia]
MSLMYLSMAVMYLSMGHYQKHSIQKKKERCKLVAAVIKRHIFTSIQATQQQEKEFDTLSMKQFDLGFTLKLLQLRTEMKRNRSCEPKNHEVALQVFTKKKKKNPSSNEILTREPTNSIIFSRSRNLLRSSSQNPKFCGLKMSRGKSRERV